MRPFIALLQYPRQSDNKNAAIRDDATFWGEGALEKRLRVSIDSLLEGVQLIDRDWRYVYVNARAAEHGQRSVDELVGRTLMDCYPEIEQTHIFAALGRVMDSRCAES